MILMAGDPHGRQRLDARLREVDTSYLRPPHRGWIRAIRDSLGMSSAELAARMGVSQQTVANLERNERRGTIKLASLERVAAALGCELAYALVPSTSLDELVDRRAHDRARALLDEVHHHSELEAQGISDDELQAQVDELAASLVDRRGLWSDDPDHR